MRQRLVKETSRPPIQQRQTVRTGSLFFFNYKRKVLQYRPVRPWSMENARFIMDWSNTRSYANLYRVPFHDVANPWRTPQSNLKQPRAPLSNTHITIEVARCHCRYLLLCRSRSHHSPNTTQSQQAEFLCVNSASRHGRALYVRFLSSSAAGLRPW